MIMTAITKITTGIILALLVTCGILYFSLKASTNANADLRAEVAIMENTLAVQEETIKNITLEKERVEKVMSQRLAAERATKAKLEKELEEAKTKQVSLEKKHEELKVFFDTVVPDIYVDEWMREDNTADNSGKDVPPE